MSVKRPFENADELRLVERAKREDLRSRQQRGVHLERRVLGRRADQDDVAGLDAREERVLLRLVEAVNLVDEDDGSPLQLPARVLGGGHHLLDFLDAGHDGAERHEARLRRLRNQARERGLAGARRSPQDDRLQPIALDGLAQRPARREHILLADELVERRRAHPLGERCVGRVERMQVGFGSSNKLIQRLDGLCRLVTLAERFVENERGGDADVERFNRCAHGDGNQCWSISCGDLLGKARALAAEKQRDRVLEDRR